jgi:uncharacterized damage-inducible protein DinB
MMIEAIKTVYECNRRATEQVLDTAEKLTEEQWLAPQTAGRGSIRDTLVHQVGGQRIWFLTWGGTLPPEEAARKSVDPEDFPDVAAVRAFFRVVDGATQAYLDELKPEMLEEVHAAPQRAGGDADGVRPLAGGAGDAAVRGVGGVLGGPGDQRTGGSGPGDQGTSGGRRMAWLLLMRTRTLSRRSGRGTSWSRGTRSTGR